MENASTAPCTLDADYRIDSFGTKFGGLRIHLADPFDVGVP
ncbi:hypothetical protein ACWGJW_05350 [Streptomyces nigrescens]